MKSERNFQSAQASKDKPPYAVRFLTRKEYTGLALEGEDGTSLYNPSKLGDERFVHRSHDASNKEGDPMSLEQIAVFLRRVHKHPLKPRNDIRFEDANRAARREFQVLTDRSKK